MLKDTVLVDVYLSRHTLHRTDPRRGGGGGVGGKLIGCAVVHRIMGWGECFRI